MIVLVLQFWIRTKEQFYFLGNLIWKIPKVMFYRIGFWFSKIGRELKLRIAGKVFVFKNIEAEIHRNGFENLNKNYSHLQNSAHSSPSPLNFLSSQSGLIRWFFLTFEYSIVPYIRKIKEFLKIYFINFSSQRAGDFLSPWPLPW